MSETTPSEKEQSPRWLDWATRTTAILAVIAALSSGRWGASNLQAILEQGKVNDTWSYFQAKSIKEHGAEQMRDLVKALGSDRPGDRTAAMQTLERQFADEAQREKHEKELREEDAHKFERRRDMLVERGFWFEMSFTALQLGVVLCTIASGAKRKTLWVAAIVIGIVGLLVLVNGFYTVVHAPAAFYQGTSQQMEYQVTAPPAR